MRQPNAHPQVTITQRQLEVLRLSCDGLRVGEIADRMGLSPRTVEYRRHRMMSRLNVRTSCATRVVREPPRVGVVGARHRRVFLAVLRRDQISSRPA